MVSEDLFVVMFYLNDFYDISSVPIYHPKAHAVRCIHGLAPLSRWSGSEPVQQTVLIVLAVFVANNIFMYSVDCFDQLNLTISTSSKEQHESISKLTLIMGASVINAQALLNANKSRKS